MPPQAAPLGFLAGAALSGYRHPLRTTGHRQRWESSALHATLDGVEVTAADIARVPPGNIRVPRADFAAVWTVAERTARNDWPTLGVAQTCRWIAHSRGTTFNGRIPMAHAPVTERTRLAFEELIEAEYLAAEKLTAVQPRPAWLVERPGWIEAVCATLRWAWARTGPPPLPLDDGHRAVG